MAKVTSKLQVTIPKAIADQYGIAPGDEVAFVGAGDIIRLVPVKTTAAETSPAHRLELFDQATRRQVRRARAHPRRPAGRSGGPSRGWTRDELYERGRAR